MKIRWMGLGTGGVAFVLTPEILRGISFAISLRLPRRVGGEMARRFTRNIGMQVRVKVNDLTAKSSLLTPSSQL